MKTIFAFFFLSFIWASTTNSIVYDALKSDSLDAIESALSSLQVGNTSSLNIAYSGALMMKKAGFLKAPPKKVSVFKDGAKLLEGEIEKNPKNIEYRFLRLAVQENAPGILKYNKNIDEDKAIIIANYGDLGDELKTHIHDFTLKSTILKPSDLIE